MEHRLSRRKFMLSAMAGGVAAALPAEVWRASVFSATRAAAATPDPASEFYFLTADEQATCAAICAQIVPSISPSTGGPAVGATQANAVVYIDRFLAAFELPASVADNPAIYLKGRWTGRNPFGDNATGEPSSHYPPDQMLSSDGQGHFVTLSPLQMLSWRSLLVGPTAALAEAPAYVSTAWAGQVSNGTIPSPPDGGLQAVYQQGLAGFDQFAQDFGAASFAQALPEEQDLMVQLAGNLIVSQLPLVVPAAATTLFPYIELHTFQGCYGLPEYRWMSGESSTFMWDLIGWDGDTQPLGTSVYDENLYGPGEGPNAGFGEPGVFQPRGGYREHRAVSYLGDEGSVLTELPPALLQFLLTLGPASTTGQSL
jgi:hypothetical protein